MTETQSDAGNRLGRGSFGGHATVSLLAAIGATVVTIVTLPFIVSGMGLPAYGLFALLGVASSLMGTLDFGFGWTTSRFVADALEMKDDKLLTNVLRVSLLLYLLIGLAGCVALVLLAPLLVEHVFQVPVGLQQVGVESARVFALAFPTAMLQVYAGSVVRGARRFDLNSAFQLVPPTFTSIAIVGAVAMGAGLLGATVALAITQALAAVVELAAARLVLKEAFSVGVIDTKVLMTVTRFATAVAVASFGQQLLFLPNRLAVGVLLPVANAGLFSVPVSLAQRLLIVPTAFGSAALPDLTAAAARKDVARFSATFGRLFGGTLLLLAPPVVLGWVWAPTLLRVWISPEFGASAGWVLRLTLVATLINSLGAAIAVAASAIGRPRIPAISALIAGATNLLFVVPLTITFGLVGAAASFALGIAVYFALMVGMWLRAPVMRPQLHISLGPRRILIVSIGAIAWVSASIMAQPLIQSRVSLITVSAVVAVAGYGIAAMIAGRRAFRSTLPAIISVFRR